MSLIKRAKIIHDKGSRLMKIYFQSFYYPALYRDVAYREQGYGLSRILWTLFGLILISYIMIGTRMMTQYETVLKQRVRSLPNLVISNGKLETYNQSLDSTRLINTQYFEWTNLRETVEIFKLAESQKMILNTDYLWLPFPGSHYFGYCFTNLGYYLPVISWKNLNHFVNGNILVEHIHWYEMLMILFTTSFFIYLFNAIMVILFIRMFAYIAKNMVMLALKEALDYKLTCRLLSLCGMPTLSFMALIINIWGINDYTKFFFMVIYMFYYYLSLRLIKAKSYFKWMNV